MKSNNKNIDLFLNPVPFLEGLKGQNVKIKLKWGLEYEGTLMNFDDYFNVHVILLA